MKITGATIDSIKLEAQTLSYLQGCRNVVKWDPDIAIDTVSLSIHLHMKYYPMGDLAHAIKQRKDTGTRFSQLEVLEIFQDMVNALTDCHKKGIIHRDIKPANSAFSILF